MGSATREALETGRTELGRLGSAVDLATGEQLFSAGRTIGGSRQLLSALTDPSASDEAKIALTRGVFGRALSAPALAVLESLAGSRWSHHEDILEAVEELGIRAIAASAPADVAIESELFGIEQTVASNSELELALGSKLGNAESKQTLVDSLFAGKVSAQTLAIVRHVVTQPRGRRIGEVLRRAATIVADQAGVRIATVVTAQPLSAEKLRRLESALSARYDRKLKINQVVDPSIIGGLRVQIGDDVIDGSIATRVAALKLQLAG